VELSQNQSRKTSAGTDIDEVKRLNAQSGKTYNEVKKLLSNMLHSERR
jgi:hypothetical protein